MDKNWERKYRDYFRVPDTCIIEYQDYQHAKQFCFGFVVYLFADALIDLGKDIFSVFEPVIKYFLRLFR